MGRIKATNIPHLQIENLAGESSENSWDERSRSSFLTCVIHVPPAPGNGIISF